ncbi:hypothetical protein F8388_009015 [Cannabis sativa]|uniref:Vacuolar protein sorting-associated protein 62 n=1 Tax=Cannabis sativa TaxID=3483 RepID=A0A7J6GJ87_CANSA|nr:hypothetical protein F8388_009015 [Cannabis sativa]
MFGCKCLYWNRLADFSPPHLEYFSLPQPLPTWPQGQGFASGRINLGELEVFKVTRFEFVWCHNPSQDKKKGVTFYKPVEIPDGFHILGHYCQPNNHPLRGYVLVAREVSTSTPEIAHASSDAIAKLPALCEPLDYILVWCPEDWTEQRYGGCGYFWLPQAPEGYMPVGILVTNKPSKPSLDEVRCVRADLTDECDAYRLLLLNSSSGYVNCSFQVWSTRPHCRGMMEKGVSVGTFFCSSSWSSGEDLSIGCLKNLNPNLHAMPNLDQIHALINHYGPTVFFHPEEVYLPSSVSWFFENGALLYRTGVTTGETIDTEGSNLPGGETNDRKFWIDLPCDNRREIVKRGNLESAKLYAHVKPALGGTFTDIAMWVFCPFNGPATLRVGVMNIALSKIGEHISDWEHFTLRISNFTGELWSIYYSQHSGGQWVDAYDLEYIDGNKAVVYASKSGHACYPRPGTYIQGSSKLGIGIRNDAARSNLFVDSSTRYELVAAEYLGDGVVTEPGWLQFMRLWGPTIVYDSKTELDKIINKLPLTVRYSVANLFAKFPGELSGQEGPTGPKEKNNWVGDERG